MFAESPCLGCPSLTSNAPFEIASPEAAELPATSYWLLLYMNNHKKHLADHLGKIACSHGARTVKDDPEGRS
jgi:hypothetical protein